MSFNLTAKVSERESVLLFLAQFSPFYSLDMVTEGYLIFIQIFEKGSGKFPKTSFEYKIP